MAYELENTAILNLKENDYRCVLSNMTTNEAVNLMKNSKLDDRGTLQMEFTPNKTPIEVIKEGAFGGTYFRDIYSDVDGKWYRKSWKEFNELKIY